MGSPRVSGVEARGKPKDSGLGRLGNRTGKIRGINPRKKSLGKGGKVALEELIFCWGERIFEKIVFVVFFSYGKLYSSFLKSSRKRFPKCFIWKNPWGNKDREATTKKCNRGGSPTCRITPNATRFFKVRFESTNLGNETPEEISGKESASKVFSMCGLKHGIPSPQTWDS